MILAQLPQFEEKDADFSRFGHRKSLRANGSVGHGAM
jgi:hypothetical protein